MILGYSIMYIDMAELEILKGFLYLALAGGFLWGGWSKIEIRTGGMFIVWNLISWEQMDSYTWTGDKLVVTLKSSFGHFRPMSIPSDQKQAVDQIMRKYVNEMGDDRNQNVGRLGGIITLATAVGIGVLYEVYQREGGLDVTRFVTAAIILAILGTIVFFVFRHANKPDRDD